MAFETRKDPTRVIIAGTGAGWEHISRNTNFTVYALNDFIKVERYGIKPDKLFIMDVLDEKPQIVSGIDDLGSVIARINQMRVPLVAPYRYEEIPLSEAFPLEEVVREFGMPYFTNTICYMIAYALLKGAKVLHLYGVNQAGSHEYAEERGGVEYWLGVAAGRGVEVAIHGANSQVMKFKGRYGNNMLYGYLTDYKSVLRERQKFGEVAIRRLTTPHKPSQRVVRKISS